jgi:hypothetical protein
MGRTLVLACLVSAGLGATAMAPEEWTGAFAGAAFVLFLGWMWAVRSRAAGRRRGARLLRPWWVLAGWLPGASLFVPYVVAIEILSASDPDAEPDAPLSPPSILAMSPLLVWWCPTVLIQAVLLTQRIAPPHALVVAACAGALTTVWQITSRLTEPAYALVTAL